MRKLALTLLLAVSLPAFSAAQVETLAQKELTAAIAACDNASCEATALETALLSGLSIDLAMTAVVKASIKPGVTEAQAQAKAIEALTKATIKTDTGSATDSIAKVMAAAKLADIPQDIITNTVTNTVAKIPNVTVTTEQIAQAETDAIEIAKVIVDQQNGEATGAGETKTPVELVVGTEVNLNQCGVSPNKPCDA